MDPLQLRKGRVVVKFLMSIEQFDGNVVASLRGVRLAQLLRVLMRLRALLLHDSPNSFRARVYTAGCRGAEATCVAELWRQRGHDCDDRNARSVGPVGAGHQSP